MASPYLGNNTIIQSYYHADQRDEGVNPTEIIYPGMLVRTKVGGQSTSYALDYILHDNTYIWSEIIFAIENPDEGKSKTDPYAIDSNMMIFRGLPGNVLITKVDNLLGAELYIGMPLCPNNTGWLRQHIEGAVDEPSAIAVSLEYDPAAVLPRWTAVRII